MHFRKKTLGFGCIPTIAYFTVILITAKVAYGKTHLATLSPNPAKVLSTLSRQVATLTIFLQLIADPSRA